MDNQQVREVAYMAGLFDGEGTFCIEKSSTKGGKVRYTPRFSLGMSSQSTVQKLVYFLQKNDISFYQTKRVYPEPYLPCYSIEVKRFLQLKKLIELVFEDLVGKKRQAELLLKFINSRLDSEGNIAYRGASRLNLGYPSWVHDAWLEVSTLNGKNKPKGSSKQLANLHDRMSSCAVLYGPEVMVSPADESCSAKADGN